MMISMRGPSPSTSMEILARISQRALLESMTPLSSRSIMSLASSLFSQTVSAVSANRPEKVVSTVESLLQSGLCMLAMPFLTLSAALAALSVPSIGEIE